VDILPLRVVVIDALVVLLIFEPWSSALAAAANGMSIVSSSYVMLQRSR